MKKILIGILSIITIQLSAQKTILVKCGKLIDPLSGNTLEKQNVLIKSGIILSVTSTTPAADSVIDLSSYFVMPGMIDCHTHVLLQGDITSEDYDVQVLKESIPYRTIRATKSAEKAIQNGFTTIRDLGTEGAGFADVDVI